MDKSLIVPEVIPAADTDAAKVFFHVVKLPQQITHLGMMEILTGYVKSTPIIVKLKVPCVAKH